ncbi:hypothetical protein ACPEEZ_04415 [Frigoribacterium sp. 2-23]|uniref:hypothetical protein n=1 Tax=Frigoribacterium sp. 2-23 TaxID=3415006 RepID=UPI003C701656
MELLFVVLGGTIIGFIAHFALPAADTRGVLLAPAFGAAVSGIVWEVLFWLGWKADGGWIWVFSLVIPAVVAVVVCTVSARRRRAADSTAFARLLKASGVQA